MDTEQSDPLAIAAAQQAGAVLSIPVSGSLRHFKARLLSVDGQCLTLETAADESLLFQQIVEHKTTVGMTFRFDQIKYIFATIATGCQQHQMSPEAPAVRIALWRPASIKTVQRRVGYRVGVSPTADCTVRVWMIPEEQRLDKKVASSQEVPLELRDISEGGLGFAVMPHDGKPYELLVNQRLRVAILCEGQELFIEGRVRHYKTLPDLSLLVGTQFVQNTDEPPRRQATAGLQQVVSKLARHEVRWKKMAG